MGNLDRSATGAFDKTAVDLSFDGGCHHLGFVVVDPS